MALGEDGGETCRRAGRDLAGEASQHSYAAPKLRSASADERNPHQLLVMLAGPLVDSDDTDISGACAGPYGELGDGAVKTGPKQTTRLYLSYRPSTRFMAKVILPAHRLVLLLQKRT